MLRYKGKPLPQEILELAKRHGVDLSLHKPRQVSAALIESADLILVFDNHQVGDLVERFPEAKGKTKTVKDYAGCNNDTDMEDLWGKPVALFERAIKEISLYVERCADRMRSNRER
jgi:protein-tyrosine phosphatase